MESPEKVKKTNFLVSIVLVIVFVSLVGIVSGFVLTYIIGTKNIIQRIEVPVEKIVVEEKIVLPDSNHSIILDDEMKELSIYIQKRKRKQPIELCNSIAYHVVTQSKKHNIPVEVVVGIIEIESMWDIYATSKAKPVSAKGLMQILIEDGVDIDHKLAYGIEYNIDKGIQILKSKLNKSKGDITLALEYYVGGDKTYHEQVYKFLGKYMLYKMNTTTPEMRKPDEINTGTDQDSN